MLGFEKEQKHVHRRGQPQVGARHLEGSNKRPAVGMKLGGSNVELSQKFPLESSEGEPELDFLEQSRIDKAEGPVGAYFVISTNRQNLWWVVCL